MSHLKVTVALAAVLIVVAMACAQTPRQAVPMETDAVAALTRALRAELSEKGEDRSWSSRIVQARRFLNGDGGQDST
jgi:hypothetical protein